MHDDSIPLRSQADLARSQRRFSDAAALYARALEADPTEKVVYLDLAFCLQQQKQFDSALEVCQAALRAHPNFVEAIANMANLSRLMGRWGDALRYFEQAYAIDPNYPELLNALAAVYRDVGRLKDAIAMSRLSEQQQPLASTGSNALYTELFWKPEDAGRLRTLHVDWAQRYAVPFLNRFNFDRHDRSTTRRLRIGYVSPHFRAHAVNFFVEPILASHDRTAVDVFCYSDVPSPDAVTAKLQATVENWRDVRGVSDDDLATMIHRDRIDILVDLAGHLGSNRLLVLARKPAPVQVTYIGYQFTSGLPNMDYRLTDATADPPGQTDAFYTEKLWRLPACFFCFQPSAASPEVGPLPADRYGFITFGCLNHFAKTGPKALSTWCRVLHAVTNSRLILLVPDADYCEKLVRDAMTGGGVDPARVIPVRYASRRAYLARYNQIDIALDPIPFNGHTTTLDALWCGVPVVSQLGTQYASRYGSVAAITLGLQDELVARDGEQYVELVTKLAGDLPKLRELRRTLRQRMSASALCDARNFTQRLEQAYRQMWTAACSAPK